MLYHDDSEKNSLEHKNESVLRTLQDLLQTWGDRGDERERIFSQVLREIGVKGIAKQLRIALGENPTVAAIEHAWVMICRTLERYPKHKRAFSDLVQFLGDTLARYAYSSDPKLAEAAVWAIEFSLTSDRLFKAVAHCLLSDHEDVRTAAQFTICNFGKKALQYLLEILPKHTHEKKCWAILTAIGECGEGLPRRKVVEAIVTVLPAIRFQGPLMIGVEVLLLHCGPLGVKTVFQLASKGPTPKVRQMAESELLYHADARISEHAQKFIKSKDERIRALANQVIEKA